MNDVETMKVFNHTVRVLLLLAALLIPGCMYGCPKYNVWEQGLQGQAELERAKQNRQIAVAQAEAKKESAQLLAEAEVLRAHGVAEANQIIGESLKGHEEYLRYLWIHNLEEAEKLGTQIIYVPTEAGLPILEAGRLQK